MVLEYLNATKKLSESKRELGKQALMTGIQMMIETKITSGEKKGAFSIWSKKSAGDSDSVWLTAYIVKCLGKAKHLVKIDDKLIFDGLEFLKTQQQPTGNFKEYGPISYYNLQTDSSQGIALTAYVTIAFLENIDYRKQFSETIEKALSYIDEHVGALNDNYALSIASYALALGGKNSTESIEALRGNAFNENGKMMYWEKDMNDKKGETKTPKSTKVEIAAYAIMAHVKAGRSKDAIPIVNWLVSQRNSGGGFSSSHDTVIGIQALAGIASDLYSDKLSMTIKLNLEDDKKEVFELNNDNCLQLQERKLSPTFKYISLNAVGEGIASFQVSYSYNTKATETKKSFILSVTEMDSKIENLLRLKVCAFYAPPTADEEEISSSSIRKSGMAVIEVQLPSGFIADSSFDLLSFAFVKVIDVVLLKNG
jgi:CD109 antigen